MARPKKQGLDYFNNDVTFYQDIKIRKLIRHKGIQAVSVYHILLCQIYAVGYYIEWDDDLPFIISEVSGLEEDYITDVLLYSIDIGLFDKSVYNEHSVLTSHAIQMRFFDFCAVAKRKVSDDTPYLLVDLRGKAVISEKKAVISEETIVFSEEKADNTEENAINSVKSTQSKGKESKDNDKESLSPPPTTSPARSEVGPVSDGRWDDNPLSAREGVKALKSDRDWLLQMQRKFGLDSGLLFRWLDSFVVDCDCRGKQQHDCLTDIKQHFNDWMTKQQKKAPVRKGVRHTDATLTLEQRWNKCYAELCHSVSADVSGKSFDLVRFLSFVESTSELHLLVPDKETYDFMEANLVSVMNRVLPKYFGSSVRLSYHLP